ncbi:SusC/RagA family TonB-linked outer membrane protein [Rufibacter glacialis]|uniref:SusC/RagA family TonB-linked outer membrane protein n=1 Tax=Rufibacter glacialis TaxID=1259555 RepID=A0A5M8QHZ4_9BACT|nr:SusC/RagA family TonB-linked outer membrane protein [Rufibacter glacialis]KAA6434570.1 SusC/RagA family TonB-linked outer membrane protein [Rufibacter glacialis]GGK70740.1 SusC/RagA family TonB-linked outer membrane protein [Rufibacter glacialis]
MKNLYKVLLFFCAFLCLEEELAAQSRQISGRVLSTADGSPVIGASVIVKGSTAGTNTDANGNYTLSAPPAATTLVVSFIGFTSQEVPINGRSSINISLQPDVQQLNEVVVTAFGREQEKRTLGYSVQEISAEQIEQTQHPNVVNALQGRVAGVQVLGTGGTPGAGSRIQIRGINSLNPGANNQPLFVIDGIPISNETIAGNQLPSAGTVATAEAGGNEQSFAFTNRAADINPDDVESMTVLKGAAATALYGIRAANGAIIITTKKGKAGATSVTFSSSYGFDNINKTPEYQTRYREGLGGRLRYTSAGAPNRFQTFGPVVTDEPFYDNFKNFFQTGTRFDNNVSVSGGNEKATFHTSASHFNQVGIVPNSDWARTTVKLGGMVNVSPKFGVTGTVSYSQSGGNKAASGDKGIMSALTYHTPTFDVNDYVNPNGTMKVYAPGVIDNPRYLAEHSTLKDDVNRIIGNIGFNYDFMPWLRFNYKIGADVYSDSRQRLVPGPIFPGAPTLDIAAGTGGFLIEERVNYRELTSNAFLTAEHSFTDDFRGSLMLGNSIENQFSDILNTRGERFGVPLFYHLSNTSNIFTSNAISERRVIGAFFDARVDYKNMLFLNVTGRNDWTSTLPKKSRSFFYPSVSTSFVFSELLGLEDNRFLNYGKLRASWAQVGKDTQPYRVGTYFGSATGFPFGSRSGFAVSTTQGSLELKPERTTSIEFGTELQFLQGRMAVDATWYRANSSDQILSIPTSVTSGLLNYISNAGEIQNTGVELLLSGSPIKTNNFNWEVIVNWSRNRSEVVSINEAVSEIIFQDDRIMNKLVVGGSAGDLYGRVFNRDAQGRLIIGANGFPILSPAAPLVKVGNALPDWQGGITNTISFKGVSLTALLEVRQGGDVYDVSMRNRIRNGIDVRTQYRYEQVIFNGVKANGEPNTTPVVLDENFYRNTGGYNDAADVLLQDASWVRLRNAQLAYTLPTSLIGKTPFKSIRVHVTGNNLFLITPFEGFDPETPTYGAGSNALGYTGYGIPAVRSYVFGLNITL